VIKPAYSVSFLLSINIFVWQNVLYFPNILRSLYERVFEFIVVYLFHIAGTCILLLWGKKSWFVFKIPGSATKLM